MTARPGAHAASWSALAPYTVIIGNPNLAMLVSVGVAIWVYTRQRNVSRADLAGLVDTSLMGAGFIILIIAASGAMIRMMNPAPIKDVSTSPARSARLTLRCRVYTHMATPTDTSIARLGFPMI